MDGAGKETGELQQAAESLSTRTASQGVSCSHLRQRGNSEGYSLLFPQLYLAPKISPGSEEHISHLSTVPCSALSTAAATAP